MMQHLLSYLIFAPLAVVVLALFISADAKRTFRILTLVVSAIQLILLVLIISQTKAELSAFQLTEKFNWFSIDPGNWGILKAEYFLGLDGLGFSMVALTVIVMLIAGISSGQSRRM